MAWNRTNTILEGGSTAETDADVIFSSALVGLSIDYGKKGQNWRLAMEPEMEMLKDADGKDLPDNPRLRTEKDKASMTKHNNLCTLVNHVVRKALGHDKFTLSWGFTPSYTAGGMIAGGTGASYMDQTLNANFKEFGRKYLTAAKNPNSRTDPWEMYIDRGAYCGLVVDNDGNAVSAMSSVRTTLKENSTLYPAPLDKQIGDRWCPPSTNPAYLGKDPKTKAPISRDSAKVPAAHRDWIWGMIMDADTQFKAFNAGMKFYCGDNNQKGTDIVGYTHGLPRAVYECVRAGKGHPYEMSIGVKTFKLASCMGCTFFMIANNFAPSASHVGKAESWAPLYHVYGNNPSVVLAPLDKDHDQIHAFEEANNKWADSMTTWIREGAAAIATAAKDEWLNPTRAASLAALQKRLSTVDPTSKAPAHRFASCNLMLDAFTWHKGDAERVVDALKIGKFPMENCDGSHWWWDTDKTTTLENYTNPYTDKQLQDFGDLELLKIA